GQTAALDAEFRVEKIRSRNDLTDDNQIRKFGVVVYLPGPGSFSGTAANPGWLDWQTVNYRRLPLVASPATVELSGAQDVTFTITPGAAVPAGTRWSWVLVTDEGRDSVETTTPT